MLLLTVLISTHEKYIIRNISSEFNKLTVVCNSKQRWNKDKCRCKCKELIDKGFIWNPSNCEYECDKSRDVGKYLDYANCKCRKKLVDKLVEECTDNIVDVNIAGMALFQRRNDRKFSCTIYVVLRFYKKHWNWYLFYLLQVHES